jgi:hypothetical protein
MIIRESISAVLIYKLVWSFYGPVFFELGVKNRLWLTSVSSLSCCFLPFCFSVSPVWSSRRCPLHVLSLWNAPTPRTRSLYTLRQTAQVLMQPNIRNPPRSEGHLPLSDFNSMSIIVQQDATIYSLFISVNCCTCFGWRYHPKHGEQFTDINKL